MTKSKTSKVLKIIAIVIILGFIPFIKVPRHIGYDENSVGYVKEYIYQSLWFWLWDEMRNKHLKFH